MKFCSKCGHQLVDEAVICTNCGCAVAFPTVRGKSDKEKEISKNKGRAIVEIFNFVFALTIILCLLFVILSFIFAYVDVDIYETWNNDGYYAWGDYYPQPLLMLLAMMTTCVTFALSATGFIITLANKLGRESVFSAITRLFLSVVLFIATLISFSIFW